MNIIHRIHLNSKYEQERIHLVRMTVDLKKACFLVKLTN